MGADQARNGSDMNKELLARVRDRIAAVGEDHCDMDNWSYGGPMKGSGEPVCGTTACIAGHALAIRDGLFVEKNYKGQADIAWTASDFLDLPNENLFYDGFWPDKYANLLQDEGNAKAMLAICDDLLDGHLTPEDIFPEEDYTSYV